MTAPDQALAALESSMDDVETMIRNSRRALAGGDLMDNDKVLGALGRLPSCNVFGAEGSLVGATGVPKSNAGPGPS